MLGMSGWLTAHPLQQLVIDVQRDLSARDLGHGGRFQFQELLHIALYPPLFCREQQLQRSSYVGFQCARSKMQDAQVDQICLARRVPAVELLPGPAKDQRRKEVFAVAIVAERDPSKRGKVSTSSPP